MKSPDKLFRCIGHFSKDPFNDRVAPYCRALLLRAADADEASDKAFEAFLESNDELLNWYVLDVSTPTEGGVVERGNQAKTAAVQ
jgi:hypothetical protein